MEMISAPGILISVFKACETSIAPLRQQLAYVPREVPLPAMSAAFGVPCTAVVHGNVADDDGFLARLSYSFNQARAAVHLAKLKSHYTNIVECLVKAGANVDDADPETGKTPASYAKEIKMKRAEDILVRKSRLRG